MFSSLDAGKSLDSLSPLSVGGRHEHSLHRLYSVPGIAS
jgi:hypothetical protein